MEKSFSRIVGISMVMSMLFACAPVAPPTPVVVVQTVEVENPVVQTVQVEEQVVKEVIRIALTNEVNTLYLPMMADDNADAVASQLYDPLVDMDNNGKIIPGLAEKWDVSADGTQYTFYLRRGVTFHNGDPFTADDVIATWEYGQKDGSAWPDRYSIAKSVERIDDFTVKVTTDGPKPLLLATMFDYWSIIPKAYMDKVGVDGFQQKPIGTGAYMFSEWVKGDHITLKANPNYWKKGQPKVETVIFRFIPESSTRVAAIQSDEIDIAKRLTTEEALSLVGVEGIKIINYPADRVYYIAFNNMTSGKGLPTENQKVRLAMNYAVDVDAIIKAIFNGYGKRATGFVSSVELGYGAVEPFAYDPAKAKQLLTEAGFPNGFKIDMACPSNTYTSFDEVCQAVVDYLGKVGIQVNLEMMESVHYWDLEANKQLPPLFGENWSESSGEAYNRLFGALGGAEAPFASWTDPEIDKMLGAISVEVNTDKRKALYGQLQVYMQENPPFIYLYEPVAFEAVRDRVQNYNPNPVEFFYLRDTSLTSNP